MAGRAENAAKTLLQIVALCVAIVLFSMIVHKASADIGLLAQKHSGVQFWTALARYFLRNLAGGA